MDFVERTASRQVLAPFILRPAFFMHMSDALLSPAVGGTLWAASAGLAACSVRRLRALPRPPAPALMGAVGAFVFAAQMINFSIPGTGSSGHLAGGLLLAILLGPHAAFLTLSAILAVQAIFFADGGLLALGANAFNLGFWPCFVVHPLWKLALGGTAPSSRRLFLSGLAGGWLALMPGALGVALQTAASGVTALPVVAFTATMLGIHAAIGLGEGLATAALSGLLKQAVPDWDFTPAALVPPADAYADAPAVPVAAAVTAAAPPARRRRGRVLVGAALGLALLAGGVLSVCASSDEDGLAWTLTRLGAADSGPAPDAPRSWIARMRDKAAVLPDYDFPSAGRAEAVKADREAGWSWGTTASGVVGSLLTLAAAGTLGRTAARRRGAGGGGAAAP